MIDKIVLPRPDRQMYELQDEVQYKNFDCTVIGVDKTQVGFKYKLTSSLKNGWTTVFYGVPQEELFAMFLVPPVPSEMKEIAKALAELDSETFKRICEMFR